jgi:biotin synthase-related radical SAM superfamily protein
MAELDVVEKKIKIQGNGIKISPELKVQLQNEGYYPIALTWIGDDVTGPFSFTEYGDNSPFELRKVEGTYQVFENGEFFTEVTFYKKPKFWDDHQWAYRKDGKKEGIVFIDEGISGVITPCGQVDASQDQNEVLKITGGKFPFITLACYNGLSIWPSWGCLYNKQKKVCRFCCIPGEYEEEKNLYTDDKWFEGLGNAVEAAVNEIGPEINKCSLTVDSGTLAGRDKGARVYIKVLETIKNKLGYLPKTYYIRAVIEPPLDEEWLYALKRAGYTDIQMDVDVYDEVERRNLMPNAKGYRSIEDYVKAFKKSKEIFPGEVATQLIAGIQDDENLLKGVEHFASLGVPTLLTPFLPFGQGKKLRRETGVDVPSADRMRKLYARAAKILNKYHCPPPQFRGGVSSLAETMGQRLKRADVLTNNNQLSLKN